MALTQEEQNGGRPTPEVPSMLKPYISILGNSSSDLAIPVCVGCEVAVLPNSLMDHLRKHHQLPAELRGTTRSFLAMHPNPCLDFDDLPRRVDGWPPIEGLRVVDAFQCKHCEFIRRDVTDVRKHVNQEHGITAAGSYEPIQAQSWFGGRRAVYWRVGGEGRGCDGKSSEEGSGDRDGEVSEASEPLLPVGIDFGTVCMWGFYGKGFGDRKPRSWRETGVGDGANPQISARVT